MLLWPHPLQASVHYGHSFRRMRLHTSISVFQHLKSSCWWWLCFVVSNLPPPCQQPKKQGDTVTRSANTAVLHDVQQAKWLWKRKTYTAFTAEQRAAIYASKHGTPATKTPFRTVFMFKVDFGGWIARRKRHLLVCYIKVLKKARHSGAAVPEVKTIGSMKWEQPVTLGDVDTNVQAYIKPCWHSCVHVWTLSWLLQRE